MSAGLLVAVNHFAAPGAGLPTPPLKKRRLQPRLARLSSRRPFFGSSLLWFTGDDWHHNGAFFLPHAFNFLASFGHPRPAPVEVGNGRFR
jgi:hypothetical protein